MGVRPPGGSVSPQPLGQPPGEDPQQLAKTLGQHLTTFIDTIGKIMHNPHLAESSTLDSLATTIEHLKSTASRAAKLRE